MVVARAAGGWALRRQQLADPFPRGVGEFDPRRWRSQAREARHNSYPGTARPVAALSDRLMRPTPARPAEVEVPLRVVRDRGEQEAADLRDSQRDKRQAGVRSPF
jgi:hypothetical protein